MTIGERIKKRRKELGLSVDQLAEQIGKDRATIYRYEKNEIEKLPINALEPLATALKTTQSYIIGCIEKNEEFTDHEKQIIKAYRNKQEMQPAIDKLLEIKVLDEPQKEKCNSKIISVLIKKQREKLNLTLKEIATFVGVSEGTVSRWESGEIRNMKRDKITKLSQILQISPLELTNE